MNLIDAFDIKNKDVITIVGAGGKTSLMFSASSLLKKEYKVLVTTTTNIYVPREKFYDKMIMLSEIKDEDYKKLIEESNKGVYVIGNKIVNKEASNKSKIKGLSVEVLDKITSYFDIVIIEGDGSKEKPLKGWQDLEPIVYNKTTKTIGVVDIKTIGLNINEDNIHRLDEFLKVINDEESQKVKVKHLKNLVLNKSGLFKFSQGEKILFINKAENIGDKKNAVLLTNKIKDENSSYINKFIYGSILQNEFLD
ncbi:putative selenium-dependent hydroxylase accessory protein YqeC [Terrisporobacter petrolearius]|uniref:selenium cofactor biosynthesis protein YqeC n=1 Tax=Terrisporobacter petrolearius TaxID=1460447 RepID=UPI001D16F8AB|nr:selenium cofactor biosynthesis protein YqeC [Terrisporobacter petrolearius]MCC3865275.1 putative selenium-dependent hydroxylase accessory protein YqeC [Terrisporobacter petrolearius]